MGRGRTVALVVLAMAAAGCGRRRAGLVVWAYVNQPDCADRAAFVYEPAKNAALLAAHTKGATTCVEPQQGTDDSACATTPVGSTCTVLAKGIDHPFVLVHTPEGFKIDVRATHGLAPDTLAKVSADLGTNKSRRLYVVRALATAGQSATQDANVTLRDTSGSTPVTAVARSSGPARAPLVAVLADGQEHRVMLALGRSDRDNEIEVMRFLQDGWGQRTDEESLATTWLPTPTTPRTTEGLMVSGGLPAAGVERVLQSRSSQVRRCYLTGLAKNPRLEGQVRLLLVVDATGLVTTVTDSGSTLPDKTAIQCMADAMKGLRFPPPDGGAASILYPLQFRLSK